MLDVETIVNKDFEGPDILEIVENIPDIDEAISVEWSNSRDEITTLLRFPGKKFVLYVRDSQTHDRVASTLGLFLKPEEGIVAKAKTALNDPKEYDWRNFCKQNQHGPSTRNILLKLAADALRKGMRPALAEVVSSIFHDGVSIVDVDVLLRLKAKPR